MGNCSFIPQGRMGNFYMEAFTAYAYAKKHGLNFSVPAQTTSEYWSPIYAKHLINDNWVGLHNADVIIDEQGHNFSELPFDENWRGCNILLRGYFQSENYFKDYRENILNDFKFKWQLKKGWCSIHLRLTDYVLHKDRHHNISDEYISNAINYFIERDINKFMVFSDDMMQAIQRINKEKYPNAQFEYSIDKTPEEDLYLGSCCEHNIISASTFSWLQAWTGRNENKIVIAPKVWFEFMNSHLNTDDIVPERWLKM